MVHRAIRGFVILGIRAAHGWCGDAQTHLSKLLLPWKTLLHGLGQAVLFDVQARKHGQIQNVYGDEARTRVLCNDGIGTAHLHQLRTVRRGYHHQDRDIGSLVDDFGLQFINRKDDIMRAMQDAFDLSWFCGKGGIEIRPDWICFDCVPHWTIRVRRGRRKRSSIAAWLFCVRCPVRILDLTKT